jgi:hypothetical protein
MQDNVSIPTEMATTNPAENTNKPSLPYNKKRIVILLIVLTCFLIFGFVIAVALYNRAHPGELTAKEAQKLSYPTSTAITDTAEPSEANPSVTATATPIISSTATPTAVTATVQPTNSAPLATLSKPRFTMQYPTTWQLTDNWETPGYDNVAIIYDNYQVLLYRYPFPAETPCLFSDTPVADWENIPEARRINLRNFSYQTVSNANYTIRIAEDKQDDEYPSPYYNEQDNLNDYVTCLMDTGKTFHEDTIPQVGVFVYSMPSNANSVRVNEIYNMLKSIKLKELYALAIIQINITAIY